MDLEYATIPAVDLKPGMHLSDQRVPLGNRVEHTRTFSGGRVFVSGRLRDRDTRRISYSGSGFALIFRPGTLVEVWNASS